MISKIFSAILIIVGLYILAVFFAPAQADEISSLIGAPNINTQIRALKTQADGVSNNLIDLKNGSLGILDNAKTTIESARSVVDTSRANIELKVDQTQAVVKSVQDLSQAASAVKNNLDILTTISGSTSSSGAISSELTASGSMSSGTTVTTSMS